MNKKLALMEILLILSLTSMLFHPVPAFCSSTTKVYVDPPSIVNPTLTPGSSFVVGVMVSDVEAEFGCYSWQVKMSFNPSILEFVEVTEGYFLAEQPEGTYMPPPKIEEGFVFFGQGTIGRYMGVTGSGTLAYVELRVVGRGESPLVINQTSTKLFEVILPPVPPGVDPIREIPCVKEDGYFTNLPPQTMDELKTVIEELGSEDQIDNHGIVKSLLAKLNGAQKLVQSDGPTTAAKNILEAFINEVQAQSGKHMTPEAAQLLIEAAEYKISDL